MSKLITLTQDKFALVDDEDFEFLNQWKWKYEKSHAGEEYATRTHTLPSGRRTTIRMHRILMNANNDEQVDHRDGNGLNNKRENLRKCNNIQNSYNRKKYEKRNSTSKYKGVKIAKSKNYWVAFIKHDGGVVTHLGHFSTEESAAHAYNLGAIECHGEFAKLNDVSEVDLSEYTYKRKKTSRYKGVSWSQKNSKWVANLWVNGKQKFLGYFDEEIQAAKCYNSKAIEYAYPEKKLNIIN